MHYDIGEKSTSKIPVSGLCSGHSEPLHLGDGIAVVRRLVRGAVCRADQRLQRLHQVNLWLLSYKLGWRLEPHYSTKPTSLGFFNGTEINSVILTTQLSAMAYLFNNWIFSSSFVLTQDKRGLLSIFQCFSLNVS